jgi:hypothetical protein
MDRRGPAGLDEDRERSRQIREDIMFFEATARYERSDLFLRRQLGLALRCQCPKEVVKTCLEKASMMLLSVWTDGEGVENEA